MALVISQKEGDAFYVNDTRVEVAEIRDALHFKLKVVTPYMEYEFDITDQKATEILPQVKVSAGRNGSEHAVKIVLEAPENIKILREKLYAGKNHS